MPACLACAGEGQLDHRADDAWFAEHHSDEQLEDMRSRGLVHPVGVVACDECEGTGVISQERYDDLFAAALAAVDQVRARFEEAERGR